MKKLFTFFLLVAFNIQGFSQGLNMSLLGVMTLLGIIQEGVMFGVGKMAMVQNMH